MMIRSLTLIAIFVFFAGFAAASASMMNTDFAAIGYPPALADVVARYGLKDPPERLARLYHLGTWDDAAFTADFDRIAADLRANVDGSVTQVAPFFPTVPGTDTFLDELF